MSRGAELFVVCKNPECRSEVSPYVTECPYCGTRLRKRAPKLERRTGTRRARRRMPAPGLSRLRSGEIPGIRGEPRPYVTAAIVAASCVMWVILQGGVLARSDLAVDGPVGKDWWRVFSTQFIYGSGLYMFGVLLAVAVFGWLLERRHGSLAVLLLFLAAGAGGAALDVAVRSDPVAYGANGAALGLLCAWAVPDLIARLRHEDYDGDLLAVAVAAVALALIPLARPDEASPLAAAGGIVIGLAAGLGLARLPSRAL